MTCSTGLKIKSNRPSPRQEKHNKTRRLHCHQCHPLMMLNITVLLKRRRQESAEMMSWHNCVTGSNNVTASDGVGVLQP